MKAARTAVQIIGIIATIASFIPGPHQPIAAMIAAAATVVSAGLAMAAKPPKQTARGSPTSYLLDPAIGIPYMIGRTQFAGACAKRDTWGSENKNQALLSVYSYGPIEEHEKFTADQVTINFDPPDDPTRPYNAQGQLKDFLFFRYQKGECPSPHMPCPGTEGQTNVPNWDPATAKLSGLYASWMWMRWDKNQRFFTSGIPIPGVVAKGVKVYDPRLDSTYPGGAGACRALDESTYVWSKTPHLHALTWALGRYQNGKRRMGVGFPPASIDIAYFVSGANVDEANGWSVGGLIWSTDDKWNALKQIMQAGGAEPVTSGGKLSGVQRRPRVSAHTITSADLIGRCSTVPTQTQRDRINGIIPRYRSETHGWERVPATVVRFTDMVALDGGERTREVDYPLVQDDPTLGNAQVRQLAAYEVLDAREFGPVDLSLKLRWVGLKPGDCVTLEIPELNLIAQKATVIARSFDPTTGAVNLKFKSETDTKHAQALGTGAGEIPPPDAPQVNYSTANPPPAPPPGQWTLSAVSLAGASGSTPALRFSGGVFNTIANEVEFAYRVVGSAIWLTLPLQSADVTQFDVSAVVPGEEYEGRVREIVQRVPSIALDLAPVTVGDPSVGWDGVTDIPDNVGGATSDISLYLPNENGTLLIEGNYLRQSASVWGWNALSRQFTVGSAYVQFRMYDDGAGGRSQGVIGIPTAQPAAINGGLFGYAIFPQENGQLWVIDAGAEINTGLTWVTGDVFALEYQGNTVRYFKNAALFRTATTIAIDKVCYFGAFVYNGVIGDIQFGPASTTPQATVTNGPISISPNYASTGALDPAGQLPANYLYKLQLNGVILTTGVTWTYKVITGGVNSKTSADAPTAMSVSGGTGTFTLTTLDTSSATIEIQATSGTITAKQTVTLIKNVAPPPVTAPTGGSSGSSISSFGQTSSTVNVYATIGGDTIGTLNATLGTGKTQADIAFNLNTQGLANTPQGSNNVEIKLQRNIAGTWTDVGATINSQPDYQVAVDVETGEAYELQQGVISGTINNTGLTAGTTVTYRVQARYTTGSVNHVPISFSGNVTVTVP